MVLQQTIDFNWIYLEGATRLISIIPANCNGVGDLCR